MEIKHQVSEFGLSHQTREAIVSVFEKYKQVEKAVLYGSRAMGTYRNGSDIDLTLFGEQLDLSILHLIEDELDELFLPYKIDLSLHDHINNAALKDHIATVGKVLYTKSN